jgi:transposase
MGVPVPDDVAKRLSRAVRMLSKWRDERDRLVVEAHDAGGGPREIARLAGVSHPTVIQIVRRADTEGTKGKAEGRKRQRRGSKRE